MDKKEFKNIAEDLGYEKEKLPDGSILFSIDGVGVIQDGYTYLPFGIPTCNDWREELKLNRLRDKLLYESGSLAALEYMRMLVKVDRA